MGQDSGHPLSWSFQQAAYKMLARAGSHLKAQLGKFTQWLLARFSSPWAIGPRASILQWLLAGGCAQFLAKWAFPTWWLASSKCTSQEGNGESLIARQKSQSFVG